MSREIISLHAWLNAPLGRYLLHWESAQFDAAVANLFGYHALQLGLPELAGLAANRMPHRWLASATPHPQAAIVTHFGALPFAEHSLDLLVLPHTLELSGQAHATLREVHRVLMPEGRVVISGFNPWSLWGLRQRRAKLYQRLGLGQAFVPDAGEWIAPWRLRDWLQLLGFELELTRFGCYRPALQHDQWLARSAWLDSAGARWWPILGAVYFLVAVKRVRGMTLLSPPWKRVAVRKGKAVATSYSGQPTPLAEEPHFSGAAIEHD
jgi:SAM-dependent methyltransferase